MAAVSTTAKIPSPLNLSDQVFQVSGWYSQEITGSSGGFGKEGMDMYDTFRWDNSSDALKIDQVLQTFQERCVPARNETCERYVFCKREQLSDEPLDSYITSSMTLSETWFRHAS